MSLQIRQKGQYRLFDTTQRYRMLALDEQNFYIWRGSDRLELSDFGHEASEILHEGDYVLFSPEHAPALHEQQINLACREWNVYTIYNLPQGLPTEENCLVDIHELPEKVPVTSFLIET